MRRILSNVDEQTQGGSMGRRAKKTVLKGPVHVWAHAKFLTVLVGVMRTTGTFLEMSPLPNPWVIAKNSQ